MRNPVITSERRPHLRVALVPYCNFHCKHCRPGGEGTLGTAIMDTKEFDQVLRIASDAGFKCAKFTGGEPLLRQRDFGDLAKIIRNARPYFDELDLVTNGSLLDSYAFVLKESGLDRLTLSLNSSIEQRYELYTGTKTWNTMLNGLKKCTDIGLPVTINCVLSKSNFDELGALIDLAAKFSTKLKLIDLMDLNDHKYWETNYLNFKLVEDKLEKEATSTSWVFPPSGLGSPMPKYTLRNGVEVLLRDATIGTNYNNSCKTCSNFPCQDALISLRLTSNGKLKKCLIRDDNLVDILNDLRGNDFDSVRDKIKSCYEALYESKFYPFKWRPNSSDEIRITAEEVKRLCTGYLEKMGFENPDLETNILLEELFGSIQSPNLAITNNAMHKLEEHFNNFSAKLPIQYQIGYTKVKGLRIGINKSVLLPGPQIDELIDSCNKCIEHRGQQHPVIVDLCTGSGVIAIALAKQWPNATVFATDISSVALKVASENRSNNNATNMTLVEGDMFDALSTLRIENKVDLLVSNPPYVPSNEIDLLPAQIRNYVPEIAINGGDDGFSFYRLIIHNFKKFVRVGGFLVLENGPQQYNQLATMIESTYCLKLREFSHNAKNEETRVVVAERIK